MSVEKIYAVNAIRKLCKNTRYKEVARRKKFNGTYDVVFVAGDYLYIVNVDLRKKRTNTEVYFNEYSDSQSW